MAGAKPKSLESRFADAKKRVEKLATRPPNDKPVLGRRHAVRRPSPRPLVPRRATRAAVRRTAAWGGLSRLTRERCDLIVSIPMLGRLSSLNVSAAAALATYEIARARLTR